MLLTLFLSISFLIIVYVPLEGFTMSVWVIEYIGIPPCWIAQPKGNAGAAFDVTFQRKYAQRFQNREDCSNETLRLGLSTAWIPRQIIEKENR